MAPTKKKGPVKRPQVTLRGRQLEVIQLMADTMGENLQTAISRALEFWMTSNDGRTTLLESYGIDITGPKAKVLEMKREDDGA